MCAPCKPSLSAAPSFSHSHSQSRNHSLAGAQMIVRAAAIRHLPPCHFSHALSCGSHATRDPAPSWSRFLPRGARSCSLDGLPAPIYCSIFHFSCPIGPDSGSLPTRHSPSSVLAELGRQRNRPLHPSHQPNGGSSSVKVGGSRSSVGVRQDGQTQDTISSRPVGHR